jgi:outer membrane murein-binding lipoprotein Lpp
MSWSIFKDEDPKPAPKPAAAPRPAPEPMPIFRDEPEDNPPTSASGTSYDRLRGRTDFAGTEVGAALAKYSEPLAGVIPDEKMRAKTAAKLAEKEGISIEKILATFDGLKVALQAEVSKFNSAGGQEEANIAAKESQIRDLSAQMAQIQSQVTQLGGEISDSRSHVNKIKTEFNSAVNRRSLELDQEKQHYAELLR